MAFDSRARIALLAFLPTLAAATGAAVDESTRLGFTTWRSACRSDGVSLGSVLQFTWQLLPNAILGALLGGFVVVCLGILWRHQARATECVAAHLGCVIAMPLGLLACALAFPVTLMPFADLALGAAASLLLWKALRPRDVPAHP
jgi:hypothetical protein